MSSDNRYTVFIRSCRNWEEFASATKRVVNRGLTLNEAREKCEQYNANRSSAQISAGTKMEFTSGEVH